MNFDKLYKSLVVSGTLLVGACATAGGAGTTGTSPAPDTDPSTTQGEAQDCRSVCTGLGDDNAVCPDPNTGAENCCWLMTQRHPCCPAPGDASTDPS